MKLNRRSLRRLIESVINEDPYKGGSEAYDKNDGDGFVATEKKKPVKYVTIPQDPEIRAAIINRVNSPDRNGNSHVVLSFINKPVKKEEGYKSYKYKDVNGSSQVAIISHLNERLGSDIDPEMHDEIELGGYRDVIIEVQPDGIVGIHVPE